MASSKIIAIKNPIIPGIGVCDPHVHIFNDKVYLYASSDYSKDNKDFVMKKWQVWSSYDMIEWTHENDILPEDMYIGPTESAWAVDAAERNGRYYLYFSNFNKDTGVAVSSNPAGPFIDALNKPLLPSGLTSTKEYDPHIFIDDDESKTPYIIFGGPKWAYGEGAGYYIARLNDDMISLAEAPREVIVNHEGDDKSSLHKHDGKYFLTFASHYAISDNVYGPYEYRGNIGASKDHGSFFQWNNQWFNAFTIYDPTFFYRASGLCYIHYKDNGDIAPADSLILEYGVGQYNSTWSRINAEWYMGASNGLKKKESPNGGFEITDIYDGSYLYYPNIHNLSENSTIYFYASCGIKEGCTIEVREGSPVGNLLGICNPSYSHGFNRYAIYSCSLKNKAGTNSLCFVFRGKESELLRLDFFRIV